MEILEYEIYTNESDTRRVKFSTGEDYNVRVDENGYEYFPVPNLYSKDKFKLFTNKVKDAYQTILDGNGDAMEIKSFGGEGVRKYVDRQYGEKLRAKFLEGWKGAEFTYSIKYGHINSMTDGYLLDKNNNIISVYEDNPNYIQFDTEEDAQKYIDEFIYPEAKKILNGYQKAKRYHNERRYLEKWYDVRKVSSQIFMDLDDAMEVGGKKNHYIKVVQVLKK